MKLAENAIILLLTLTITLMTIEISNSIIRYALSDKQDYTERQK